MDLGLQNLCVQQGGFVLTADRSMKVGALGLSGKSGAGKTTFLELLAGLRRPQRGRLVVNGQVWDDAATGAYVKARDRRIGYVPQDAELFPHLNVRQNLLFGAARAGGAGPGLDAVVSALGLSGLLGRPAWGVSGGERRRVVLGRALLSGAEWLLLDEPFSGLDTASRALVRDNLTVLQKTFSIPWILVSHDRDDLDGLCAQVESMRDGRLLP